MKRSYIIQIAFAGLMLAMLTLSESAKAQGADQKDNLVYVDKQGVLRYSKTNAEAAFFGVNYTVPFAYAYRAHKALDVDIEKAIKLDVYHLARLGLDAFRVHVWDTEITDSLGNLLNNDHVRLFDFLLAELKKRNIRAIITPIAFWGNGYPEQDERTPGFSRVYGKGRATSLEEAIKAQENYLQQFFNHVNPYTGLTYKADPNVIAAELNNEPSHSGPKPAVTAYINRLVAASRKAGFTKPLFYNVSQSTFYVGAMAASNVDGFSFQWYPAGLVAGQSLKGNYLPHVDKYKIPYDTIPAFNKKPLMVYEFESADNLQSYMYPVMAKSFREAGFQWATQFAYDPTALAYANTEYQTHYLNLAYTPSKAISMLVASEVFHKVPRLKDFGTYPSDSLFDAFHVSYKQSLSEMNTEQKYYYTNTTQTKPLNVAKLTNVAGVGSSPVVRYSGSGAYFLDKAESGAWRLEVMPDAVALKDPFERASPKKEVTRLQWDVNAMQISLPDLGSGFSVKGINDGNAVNTTATGENFKIGPGTYLLVRNGKTATAIKNSTGSVGMTEFGGPQPVSSEIDLVHTPFTEVSSGKPFTISAKIVGLDSADRVTLQVSRLGGGAGPGGGQRTIVMQGISATDYTAEVPADLLSPGVLTYRINIKKGSQYVAFPGKLKGNPASWDFVAGETWKTFVAAPNGRMELYNPTTDRNVYIYQTGRRNFQTSYITGDQPGQLTLRLAAAELTGDHTFGFQYYFADKLAGRTIELPALNRLFIRAKSGTGQSARVKVTLTNKDAQSVSAYINLTGTLSDVEVPLSNLSVGSALLLPRPYPPFLPLTFTGSGSPATFKLQDAEKIQITAGEDVPAADYNKPISIEVSGIWLQKDN